MAHNYTQAVLSEIHKIRNDKPILVHSIYFGGGTPSLAPIETLTELVRAIQSSPNFDISQSAEWTMEMDPGTFDVAKLQTIRDLGFNRISLGVQSFDDTMLESLGRVHRLKDIQDSLSMLAQVFGNNVNYSLDLISALPGLTLAHWTETLQTAVLLDPAPRHISIYDLQIESGTVFGKWYETKDGDKKKSTNRQRSSTANTTTAPLPSDADASFMYRYASGYLAARNFEHYEVSSYARLIDNQQVSPWRSQHNQIYWTTNGQWYAFGLGATSFVDGVMQARPRTLIDYTNWATEYTGSLDDDGDALMSRPTDLDFLQDIVLKRLRTKEGLDLDWVHAHFGDEHIVHAIRKGAELAIDLDLAKVDGSRLKLSDPDGLLFSNTIISTIFVECEAAFDAKDTAKIKQL
jgi:oxygen-independent coproporphyrinogen-3 oxidase